MDRWSVYGRVANGCDDAETHHLNRLAASLPPVGSVRCSQVSKKLFANMKLLFEQKIYQETRIPLCCVRVSWPLIIASLGERENCD
jgi:CRISPR-associated protein Cas2